MNDFREKVKNHDMLSVDLDGIQFLSKPNPVKLSLLNGSQMTTSSLFEQGLVPSFGRAL